MGRSPAEVYLETMGGGWRLEVSRVTVLFCITIGYSTVAASMVQVLMFRVAMQESSMADAKTVSKTRIGAPVEFVDIVVLIAKITAPTFCSAEKSRPIVFEVQV